MVTDPRMLLEPEEDHVPPTVLRTLKLLSSCGVWHRLSRNRPALSCRDAASKRRRLGREGIELRDELKSFLGTYIDEEGQRHYFLAHCRGDRRLDLNRLQVVLGAPEPPARVDDEQIATLGLAYGLVNPFDIGGIYGQEGVLLGADLRQIFDAEVTTNCGLPGTIMTNAGDLTWAVEFDASELIEALPQSSIAAIAEPDPDNPPRPWGRAQARTLGLITGNAPESGISLWNKINARVRESLGPRCLGDISMPEVIVHSLPAMGLTMELDLRHQEVWGPLRDAVLGLAERGADTLAIACNTSQYFVPKLRAALPEGVELVSLPEVLAEWLRSRSLHKLVLVGIHYVADLGQWSGYRESLQEFEVEPLSDVAKARLHELAYKVKVEGANHAGLSRLRHILSSEVESDCVVLALTELSLLLDTQRRKGRSGKLLVDPLEVFAEALACRFLQIPFPTPATR